LIGVTGAMSSLLRFLDGRTEIATYGILGYALFGKKGAAIGAGLGLVKGNIEEIADDIRLQFGGAADSVEILADKIEGLQGRVEVATENVALPFIGKFFKDGLDKAVADLAAAQAEMAAIMATVPYAGLLDQETASIASATADGLDLVTTSLQNFVNTYGTLPDGASTLIAPGAPAANDASSGTPPLPSPALAMDDEPIGLLALQQEKMAAMRNDYFAVQLSKEAQFQDTWTLFQNSGARDRFSILTNETSGALGILGQHSRKMFELNKAVGLANATVYIAEGMTAAWKLGWPLGAVAAATVALNGAAQIASINAAKFGQSKIATPVSNVDSSVGSGNVAQPTTTSTTSTETSSSIVVQIYPPIGASQEQIDEAINLAVARNVESGQMIPDTEIVFNNRAIA